jgi:hypothetical protein
VTYSFSFHYGASSEELSDSWAKALNGLSILQHPFLPYLRWMVDLSKFCYYDGCMSNLEATLIGRKQATDTMVIKIRAPNFRCSPSNETAPPRLSYFLPTGSVTMCPYRTLIMMLPHDAVLL